MEWSGSREADAFERDGTETQVKVFMKDVYQKSKMSEFWSVLLSEMEFLQIACLEDLFFLTCKRGCPKAHKEMSTQLPRPKKYVEKDFQSVG